MGDVVCDDFLSSAVSRLSGKVDILFFNPPYVVTSTDECAHARGLEASWAGGVDGREVIDRFLRLGYPQVYLLTRSN